MTTLVRDEVAAALVAALATLAITLESAAHADDAVFRVDNPVYVEECASCHVPFPPALLPAPAWKRIVAGLDRHFGSNAGIDTATAAQIEAYLVAGAARGKQARSAGGTLRITETAWFIHEHDEIAAHVWRSADVGSRANCGACHLGAARGDYSERRAPK